MTPGPDAGATPGASESDFYSGLATASIDLIEFPLLAEGAYSLDPAWIEAHLAPEWDLMITAIPRTMARLGDMATYGLASTDEGGRAAALADIAHARDLAQDLAQRSGRSRVVAIELHSAPGPHLGSLEALERSLTEILGWDFTGAELLIEHCDALIEGQEAAKGFFTLDDEIEVLTRFEETHPGRTGISINWGRSAIEGRGCETATAHIEAAREAGLLRALIFSGATGADSAWGPAWSDGHIPPAGPDGPLAPSSDSLLDDAAMRAALEAAGPDVAYLGAKISIRPLDADVPTRLAIAQATLGMISEARG